MSNDPGEGPPMHRIARITAIAFALALAAPAAASARDANHDRLPDHWERVQHLSLKVDQARRDQPRDGVRIFGEYRHHTDPRKADTDGDGLRDGADPAPTEPAP